MDVILPDYCRAHTLILGVGNVLFGDDGFGPAVVEHLHAAFRLPEGLVALDAGTSVRKVLFTLSLSPFWPAEVVVIDAVDWGQTQGQVLEVPLEHLPTAKLDDFSLHQVPTSNLLRELRDYCGVRVTVIVCDVGPVPQQVQPGLSSLARQAVAEAGRRIAAHCGLETITSRG